MEAHNEFYFVGEQSPGENRDYVEIVIGDVRDVNKLPVRKGKGTHITLVEIPI